MDKYEFTHVVDFIFKNRDKYNNLTDEDKERNFFIINRKFARQYPIHANFFNKKGNDKATALDIWFSFFYKKRINGIPQWYWYKKAKGKSISKIIKKDEINYLMEFYDITEDDVLYLVDNYTTEIKEEIRKYRKFNKK